MRRLIEGLSLLILVTVTIVRPLVPETYDSGVGSITAALGSLSEPYPVRTLIFDLLILSGTCGWLLVRAMEPGRAYRRTGLEYGAALVAVACVASCLTAGNKRLAINASLDWLCLPVLTIALVQLMYKAWHRRVFLAALLATACVQSAQCFDQYFLSFDDTWEHYQSVREDLWATQGVELDAPQVTLFERRLLAREASGALSHSNIAGSYLVLCGFPAVGVLLATWRRARDWLGRLAAGGAALGTGVILSAVPLTKSLGAMVSAAIGVVLWSVLWHARKWTKTHRVRAVVLGWGVAAAALGTTLCYGVWRGSFPHSSLTFRWKYWVASYDMIADHALTGVGRENFGRHYLQYKAIESPEEVTNPHNVLVQAAAEWGLPGALGLVVMLIGASVTITSGRRPEVDRHSLPTPDKEHDLSETSQPGLPHRGADPPAPNWALIWMVALLLAVTVGRWHLHDTDDPNYLYFITVASGVVWLTAFLCFGGANVSTTSPESSEPVVRAAAVGLFAFILHDMISFALFVPSAATTAFALLAFCMAGGSGVEPRASGEPSASARTTQPT
ncbi:MAG: O-antigen ligase family protein, partial [Phycisphaerae bacterium]